MSTERKRSNSIEFVPVDTENTVAKQCGRLAGLKPFRPGQSGNPKGRPKSARSRISEAFLRSLADHFASHGATVIAKVREDRPADYLKIVSAVIPREVHITTDPMQELSDDELEASIQYLLGQIHEGQTNGAS